MRVEKVIISEQPLIDAYRDDFSKVTDFFQYDPHKPAAFEERYAFLEKQVYQRQTLIDVLMSYNTKIGAGQRTLTNIQTLKSPETMVVITGQQAGILTGPLYTIYKALTVVQLAEHLSKRGLPTLPVFWIASEDHDFQEIASVYLLNPDHQGIKIQLKGENDRRPIGKLNLQLEVQQLIDQFATATLDTEFKAEMISKIRRLAEESHNLVDWFAKMMAWLFNDTGMIFVDALEPEFRKLGQDLFLRILDKNEQISNRLDIAGRNLLARGYLPQVQKAAHQVHLFLIAEDGRRYPLDKLEQKYYLRGQKTSYDQHEIQNWLIESPETVSTNVVTRPLFQDLLFPTIAYVGGPGEIAYYAQFKEVYPLLGMEMPIIYPRASLTLLEPSINKGLEKYQLTPIDIIEKYSDIRERFLRQTDEFQITAKFKELRDQFVPKYQTLIGEVSQLDEKFAKIGERNLQRIVKEITYFEDKAQHQHRKNSQVLLHQLDKLKMNIYPDDIFQERRLNIFPYLFKYQTRLVDELLKIDLSTLNCHHLIYL